MTGRDLIGTTKATGPERDLTFDERMRWGTCPVCTATVRSCFAPERGTTLSFAVGFGCRTCGLRWSVVVGRNADGTSHKSYTARPARGSACDLAWRAIQALDYAAWAREALANPFSNENGCGLW